MIERLIASRIVEALSDTPVVFIRGARQVGKTTLVKLLAGQRLSGQYFTLDNAAALAAATSDPAGFLAGLQGPAIIDEAQKAPVLFAAIKETVDVDRRPGRFLLTGSSNVLTSMKVADSLAGRMETVTLWPLAQREIEGNEGSFIDLLFGQWKKKLKFKAESREQALTKLLAGGYPEPVGRISERRKSAWFDSYISAIMERDIKDIANIQDVGAMLRLMKVLASRSACLLNYAELSRSLALPQTTLKRYMGMLESLFVVYELPAWSANIGKRFVKSPKIMFIDTGLSSSLLGFNMKRAMEDSNLAGGLLENFVVSELHKQIGWSETEARLFHFRESTGKEVDVVVENREGAVAGVEVKSASTVSASDFAGLKTLKDSLGKRFVRGVVLYLGSEVVPFGENLHAMPLCALWDCA
ncbi:MAG TPA: ATP-binding protein [bacterium]|nr:ATP-binding protein [bacterium]HPI78370.1 ATP-binding protein [bacterium]HPN95635.1 ATP-binding protein [bacterium]